MELAGMTDAAFGSRLRILVLFSGGQGASEGYRRAGFHTVDVDNNPGLHPPAGYPYVVGDALDAMRCLLSGDGTYEIDDFAAIHASPPCQRWTRAQNARKNADAHPDLITPLRPLLIESGAPYVIENVPGAPLIDPVSLCGTSFGLRHDGFELRRERLFETNWGLAGLQCAHDLPAARVFGHGPDAWFYKRYGRGYSYADQRALMETPWAHWDEIGDMIPPAFTEYVGRELLAHLDRLEVAA